METDRQLLYCLPSPLSTLHYRMEVSGSQSEPKYGRIVASERRLELRYLISEPDQPDTAQEVCVASWSVGDSNLVISVPHGGTLGADTSPAGNILCETGHLIETRKCTTQFPSLTYTRDAGTEVIGRELQELLGSEGLRPHVIECHVHRSKVECNRHISEVAVQILGQEAQQVYDIFHDWIQQALHLGLTQVQGNCALLIDLHGHGHPHEYIELGYRLSAAMLNNIAEEQDSVRLGRVG